MSDREKVIYDIERCICHVPDACRDCSHDWSKKDGDVTAIDCMEELMADALALLKEQEADGEWIYGENETGADGWYCSKCGFFEPWFYKFTDDNKFIRFYGFCPSCGRKMTSYTGKITQNRG